VSLGDQLVDDLTVFLRIAPPFPQPGATQDVVVAFVVELISNVLVLDEDRAVWSRGPRMLPPIGERRERNVRDARWEENDGDRVSIEVVAVRGVEHVVDQQLLARTGDTVE